MIVMSWLTVAFVLFQFSDQGLGTMIAIQLFAGMAMNAPYTLVYAIAFDSAGKGSTGVASSIVFVGISLGGIAPLVVGWVIGLGGGFGSNVGYNISLYLLAGLMLASVVLVAFYTRETVGWYLKHDKFARVSKASCGLAD
jgi:MFS family permease